MKQYILSIVLQLALLTLRPSTKSAAALLQQGASSAHPFTASASKNFSLRDWQTSLNGWSGKRGESMLQQVQYMASKVAESTAAADKRKKISKSDSKSVAGTGGVVYNNIKYNRGAPITPGESLTPNLELSANSKREEQVWTALANLELDSKKFLPKCMIFVGRHSIYMRSYH